MSMQSYVSVKDFGARGDGVYLTGLSIENGKKEIIVNGLTPADVGKLFYIDGAGKGWGTLVTKIAAVAGSTITLAHSAYAKVSDKRGFYGTDDNPAVAAAVSKVSAENGGVLFFPRGIYGLGRTLTITSKSVRLLGVGAGSANADGSSVAPVSELRFTCKGDGVFFDGGTTGGLAAGPKALLGCGVADLSICGTSHLTNCLRIRNTHHSHFARIRVADCTRAGLKTEFAVANVYDHFRYSINETPALNNALPKYGIHLSRSDPSLETTASHFIVPIIEGSMNGYFEEYGSTNIITGGTFEGCQEKGMIIGRFSSNGVYSTIDLEANKIGDIEVQPESFGHVFEGILAISGSESNGNPLVGGIIFHPNSYNCTVIGGEYQNIRIQSGQPAAQLITLVGVLYLNCYSDNGINTRNLGTWFGPSGLWDITKIPAGISIGNGSGVIKNHYQKIGVKVIG